MTLKFGSFTNFKQGRAGYRLRNKISGQGRAGYAKKLTGQGRVRLRKYQQGRLQVTKIPYPAELYTEVNY
jgi:hypothetical protein